MIRTLQYIKARQDFGDQAGRDRSEGVVDHKARVFEDLRVDEAARRPAERDETVTAPATI